MFVHFADAPMHCVALLRTVSTVLNFTKWTHTNASKIALGHYKIRSSVTKSADCYAIRTKFRKSGPRSLGMLLRITKFPTKFLLTGPSACRSSLLSCPIPNRSLGMPLLNFSNSLQLYKHERGVAPEDKALGTLNQYNKFVRSNDFREYDGKFTQVRKTFYYSSWNNIIVILPFMTYFYFYNVRPFRSFSPHER